MGRWRWGKERVALQLMALHPRLSEKSNRWDIDHRVYLRPTAAMMPSEELDADEDEDDDLVERSSKSKSFWNGPEISSDAGKRSYKELMPEVPYDFPKAVDFMKRCLQIGCSPDDTILDLFAGSGTTGQAILEANADDQGHRRFILVQLPEAVNHPRFKTIADITRERVRRTAKKLSEADSDRLPVYDTKPDRGFRRFKLDTSNIRAWEPNREDLAETLEQSVANLKSERTEQDILCELLLKLGLDLTVLVEAQAIHGKKVHSIGAGVLMACLDETIAPKDVEPLAHGIAGWHKKLAPAGETTVVFRDSAFANDVAKTNLTAILQQHGLENVRSL